MVNGFCQSTIIVDGFSMVFLHVNHWCQWFFNGFSDFNHWYQWFFQWFFPIEPLPLNEWLYGSPLTSMVYQWFWEKLKLVHKKAKKQKKAWFVQQIPRGKQTLDRLTWPNVTKKLHTQIDMFTSGYAESSLSCTLSGLWMTEKGWIKGTVNHTACWAHSASNIQNQHILQIPLN